MNIKNRNELLVLRELITLAESKGVSYPLRLSKKCTNSMYGHFVLTDALGGTYSIREVVEYEMGGGE